MKAGIPARWGGTEGTAGVPGLDLSGSPETTVGEPDMVDLQWDTQLGSWGFWEGVAVAMAARSRASCGVEAG